MTIISAEEAKEQSKQAQKKIVLDSYDNINEYIKQHTNLGFTFATLRVNKNISHSLIEKLMELGYNLEVLPFYYESEEVIDISWV